MVDFSKKLKKAQTSKATDPREIYATLDRTGAAGPTLRPSQENVLCNWYDNHKDDKDVIIKLQTGEGKTLVGLLILQSKINMGEGTCLYIAPNKQLAKQVEKDAIKFGVKYEILQPNANLLPLDFKSGKKLLITYVQKVFNGKTIFGLDNDSVEINTILLDDSHACIESIRSSYTMRIKRLTSIFEYLINIFREDLNNQGAGDLLMIQNTDRSSALLQIPYWAWLEKIDDVRKALYDYISKTEDGGLFFAWPILQNCLEICSVFVTSAGIEIVPDCSMIQRFKSFTGAKQRVLMSATTQEDSFFIKGLGISKNAVLNRLHGKEGIWSGEKMILFPSLMDNNLNAQVIREWVCKITKYNVAILVPSFQNARFYESQGCTIVNNENMEEILAGLSNNTIGHPVVFANRYDGVDLADDRCRILVIDSLPHFDSLYDRYEESCREDSGLIYTKIAQKIEQGFGRSVRSEKDYSVIIVIGEELVHFVKGAKSQKYFSKQTRRQIEIGDEVTEGVKEEMTGSNIFKAFVEVIGQCLTRDEGWKLFYNEQMKSMQASNDDQHPYIDILEKEYMAECALYQKDYKTTADRYQEIANMYQDNPHEQGWYLQLLAKCMWHANKTEYEKIQSKAYCKNNYLLMPPNTFYKKTGDIPVSSLEQTVGRIKSYGDFFEFKIAVDSILSNLTFGISSKKFEKALQELGTLLGYDSTRPDNQFKSGPDNLWEYSNNHYLLFECKSEKIQNSTEITKDEVGQMWNHISWFKDNYGKDESVKYIFVHPATVLSKQADIDIDIFSVNREALEQMKNNVRGFVQEFERTDFASISKEQVSAALKSNKLDYTSLESSIYLKKCVK